MKVIFTGSQGTGKTSVLKYFEEDGENVITEVVRRLNSEQGLPINENGTHKSQEIIFNEYKKLLSTNDSYVSDRGLVDVIAYTMWISNHDPDNIKLSLLLATQMYELVEFNRKYSDVIWVYFPIQFPVMDDGVRSVDEKFRKKIDENIRALLKFTKIKYIEVPYKNRDEQIPLSDIERYYYIKTYLDEMSLKN